VVLGGDGRESDGLYAAPPGQVSRRSVYFRP
jgi:hypothetical protein